MNNLSHFDAKGAVQMVDVGDKTPTKRTAIARAIITMQPQTLIAIRDGQIKKGDVIQVARIAGIMAAKKTPDLIPLCHPLQLTKINIDGEFLNATQLQLTAECQLVGLTGVEMEALTAVSVAALTVYDMVKAIDKAIVISEIKLLEKRGGKSGDFFNE